MRPARSDHQIRLEQRGCKGVGSPGECRRQAGGIHAVFNALGQIPAVGHRAGAGRIVDGERLPGLTTEPLDLRHLTMFLARPESLLSLYDVVALATSTVCALISSMVYIAFFGGARHDNGAELPARHRLLDQRHKCVLIQLDAVLALDKVQRAVLAHLDRRLDGVSIDALNRGADVVLRLFSS